MSLDKISYTYKIWKIYKVVYTNWKETRGASYIKQCKLYFYTFRHLVPRENIYKARE